jgi:hypothetical protein
LRLNDYGHISGQLDAQNRKLEKSGDKLVLWVLNEVSITHDKDQMQDKDVLVQYFL